MTRRVSPHGIAMPPPRRESGRATFSPDAVPGPSALVFASAVILGLLTAASVALLALAFVARAGLAVALSLAGFMGLVVLRVAAMYGGWLPRGVPPAPPRPASGTTVSSRHPSAATMRAPTTPH